MLVVHEFLARISKTKEARERKNIPGNKTVDGVLEDACNFMAPGLKTIQNEDVTILGACRPCSPSLVLSPWCFLQMNGCLVGRSKAA